MRETPVRAGTRRAASDEILVAARFGTPAVSPAHVRRTRLTAALAGSDDPPLVVVSAPAGTGKTALVAEWVRGEADGTTCWVAFEDGELSFWGPVLESLRRQGLEVPEGWTVPAGGALGIRRLSTLVELIVRATERVTVVVDGYDLASRALAREVDLLLRRTPGRLRFVFVGRVDPVQLVHRYRLTDSVLELRAPDLAFSDEEAGRLLRSSGVELADGAVHDLNQRLSGWAAGLRFAARALSGRDDAEGFAAMVVEHTSDINEYLVSEVLDVQPPDVRRFLLDTCVTDVFSAELAELVGGRSAVRTMLDLVDRRAFVEPVPGHPDCYRYFPFFRNLLMAELSYESPERLVELRRIASSWYRYQGSSVRSLTELATVGDWRQVAVQLVADGLVGDLLLEDQGGALGAVAERVPPDLALPAARVVRAATALRHGDAGRERSARELTLARRAALDQDVDPGVLVSIAVTDALRACLVEDCARAAEVVAEAERMVAGWPTAVPGREASALETVVMFARGVVALRLGDLAGAHAGAARAAMLAPDGVAVAFRADCLGHLAVADALQGELAAAVRHAEESLTISGREGYGHLDVRPTAHVALAWVGVERCDARLVQEHLTAARSSRMLPGDSFCHGLVEAATAVLEQSSGQGRSAMGRLEAAAAASAVRDPCVADQLRVEAARLSVCTGEPERALDVLESVQLPDRPEPLVAAAAALAEQGRPHSMGELPMRDGSAPLGTQVRALLVEASQASQQRSPEQARSALSRALRLAARERMRRPFRESGASVRRLLATETRLVGEHEWLQHVGAHSRPSPPPEDGSGQRIVVEPLTVKELEVLGHLAELLTTDEIAQKMFVSVNTVRTHIRNILRKLGVSRRNAAIRRARELGLLED